MSGVTYGSVCSGIEAASVAWHPLGWRAAWLAEIEAFPSTVLAHHYPDVPNLGDMTAIAAKVRAGAVAAPDVLVGGTPCQAYSVAGLRQSLNDPRGQLTLSFVDLANAIDTARLVRGEPAAVIVWENVPGVLSTKDNAFGCFLGGLAGEDCALVAPGGKWPNAGCVFGPQRTIAWRVFDAQYFGVAQRRRRLFVVASAREGFDPVAVLFEQEGVRRDTAPRREARQDAAVGTLRSTGGGSDVDHARAGHLRLIADGGMPSTPGVVSTLDASYARLQGASGQDANHGHSHLLAYAFQPRIARNGRGDMGDLVNALTAQAGETGKGDAAPCVAYAIQAGALRTNPASGPDGVGVQRDIAYTIEARAEVQAVAFDTTQITSPGNYSNPKPGDPCHPLAAGAHPPAVAFSCKNHGGDASVELSPTLRAMGYADSHANGGGQLAVCIHADAVGRTGDAITPSADAEGRVRLRNPGMGIIEDGTIYNLMASGQPHAICVTGDITHTLKADGFDASEDGTGRGQPIVAWTGDGVVADPISASEGKTYTHEGTTFRMHNVVQPTAMAVRRLTPRECERLQAFPDDYTLIPGKRKNVDPAKLDRDYIKYLMRGGVRTFEECMNVAADGPRYKALGNSMCVFNMRWIGARIAVALAAEAALPQPIAHAQAQMDKPAPAPSPQIELLAAEA